MTRAILLSLTLRCLIVSDDPTPEQVRQGRAELRQLRRPEDPFVYEAVTVPSFEEGVLGVVLNADVQAVVIRDNFRFKSQFDAPLLRTYLEQHLLAGIRLPGAEGLRSGSRAGYSEDPS